MKRIEKARIANDRDIRCDTIKISWGQSPQKLISRHGEGVKLTAWKSSTELGFQPPLVAKTMNPFV